jgi:sec-independent protein translocase protein TatB
VLNLGTGEVLVILVVALVVLGPDKLPGAARQAGQWLGELRRISSGFQAELRDALQEPVDQTPRPAAVPPSKDEPEPEPDPGPG